MDDKFISPQNMYVTRICWLPTWLLYKSPSYWSRMFSAMNSIFGVHSDYVRTWLLVWAYHRQRLSVDVLLPKLLQCNITFKTLGLWVPMEPTTSLTTQQNEMVMQSEHSTMLYLTSLEPTTFSKQEWWCNLCSNTLLKFIGSTDFSNNSVKVVLSPLVLEFRGPLFTVYQHSTFSLINKPTVLTCSYLFFPIDKQCLYAKMPNSLLSYVSC